MHNRVKEVLSWIKAQQHCDPAEAIGLKEKKKNKKITFITFPLSQGYQALQQLAAEQRRMLLALLLTTGFYPSPLHHLSSITSPAALTH